MEKVHRAVRPDQKIVDVGEAKAFENLIDTSLNALYQALIASQPDEALAAITKLEAYAFMLNKRGDRKAAQAIDIQMYDQLLRATASKNQMDQSQT